MTYVTGDAADMDAVKTALVDACTNNGWTEDTDSDGKTVLVQDDSSLTDSIYVRVESVVNYKAFVDQDVYHLEILGRTSLDGGDTPEVVCFGDIVERNSETVWPVSFPVTYHAFVFIDEVFFIINYGDVYQWCAFGQSNQSGLPGTGNWVCATIGANKNIECDENGFIAIDSESGASSYHDAIISAAFFWTTSYTEEVSRSGWIHTNFENSYPWTLENGTNAGEPMGIQYLTELVDTQPNAMNSESVLMPIRVYKKRPDSKVSQILEVKNARYIRIDNYAPEEVITLGTDEWMTFPFYAKNIDERNGGDKLRHTGTFGWAIKKV